RALGVAERDQRGPEIRGIGGHVERVHAVPDLVGPALAEVGGDPAQPAIPGRRDAAAAEQDRLRDPVALQPLRRRPDAAILALAEHDARTALRGALEQVVPEAHRPNFPARAAATEGCTSPPTSPPKRATSRTR